MNAPDAPRLASRPWIADLSVPYPKDRPAVVLHQGRVYLSPEKQKGLNQKNSHSITNNNRRACDESTVHLETSMYADGDI